MNHWDFAVVIAAQVLILVIGWWSIRKQSSAEHYLRNQTQSWFSVGIGIMATQASAITFLSAPGLAYAQGVGFIQFYLGMPIALWIIARWGLPWFYRLKVVTAYEYLEHRFDVRVRRLASLLFLAHRGVAAGLTIYPPALVFHYALGWNLTASVLGIGAVVMAYTVTGGARAVSVTQKVQMGIITVGMAYAGYSLIGEKPDTVSWSQWLYPAQATGRMEWFDFNWDWETPYTVWSGLLGGTFLMLSYFGTDQSQVQRYLGGADLKQSRWGLKFNSWIKIPFQASILFLGVLLFAAYSRQETPLHFNESLVRKVESLASPQELKLHEWRENRHQILTTQRRDFIKQNDKDKEPNLLEFKNLDSLITQNKTEELDWIKEKTGDKGDTNLVFLHYVLNTFPHGLLGLLIAVLLAASMSSTSAELSALTSSTAWDWSASGRIDAKETAPSPKPQHLRWITFFWGAYAIGFALMAHRLGSLIEAVNAIGSLVYGSVLGIFVVGWFFPQVRGKSVFWSALLLQAVILYLWFTVDWPFLWYNPLGCLGVVVVSWVLEFVLFKRFQKN